MSVGHSPVLSALDSSSLGLGSTPEKARFFLGPFFLPSHQPQTFVYPRSTGEPIYPLGTVVQGAMRFWSVSTGLVLHKQKAWIQCCPAPPSTASPSLSCLWPQPQPDLYKVLPETLCQELIADSVDANPNRIFRGLISVVS